MTISTDKYKMGYEEYKWESKTWTVNWEHTKDNIIGIERHDGTGHEYGCADWNAEGSFRTDIDEAGDAVEMLSWVKHLREHAELAEEGLY